MQVTAVDLAAGALFIAIGALLARTIQQSLFSSRHRTMNRLSAVSLLNW